MPEMSWDMGEWWEFWDDTNHEANDFEATPPPCKHSAIRVAVLTAPKLRMLSGYEDPVVWAWRCRLCGEAMYEVPLD